MKTGPIRNRGCRLSAGALICLAVAGGTFNIAVHAADTTDEIAGLWLETTGVVLARHVDPPTRQEMLKTTVQAVCQLAGRDEPAGLATTISGLSHDDQLRAFLRTTLDAVIAESPIATDRLQEAVMGGLLARVTAGQGLIPLEEFYVQQQLRDNRYVGIGIQLGMQDNYPTMMRVFPRGPAWNAGGRDGDRMVSINGFDGRDMPLARVIELLRGQEGKPATVVVRRGGSDETRTLDMVRDVVPFDTVQGASRDKDQNWQYKTDADPRIAYLKIESIRGSTPAELRRIAGQLHADDCRAVILDLRRAESGELRYAVMVADALLGEGPIGQVREARGRRRFDSSADQLFPGWPLAVLIDGGTDGQAEWIAAAVHDSGRGILVGSPAAGQGAVSELVELPGGVGGVRMNTGVLYRRGGKPLVVAQTAAVPRAAAVPRTAADASRSERRVPADRARNAFQDWIPGYPGRGLPPDHTVASTNVMAAAVRLLQAQLDPEAAADPPPATGPGVNLKRGR